MALLNAHLDDAEFASKQQDAYFRDEFERVFCFRPVRTPEPNPQELLVYRAHPGPWKLGRMRSSGRPQELLAQDEFFSREDIEEALTKAGPMEQGALEAIGSFFSALTPK